MTLEAARRESSLNAAYSRLEDGRFVIVYSTHTVLWVYQGIDEYWYDIRKTHSISLEKAIGEMNAQMATAQCRMPSADEEVWLPLTDVLFFWNPADGKLVK